MYEILNTHFIYTKKTRILLHKVYTLCLIGALVTSDIIIESNQILQKNQFFHTLYRLSKFLHKIKS